MILANSELLVHAHYSYDGTTLGAANIINLAKSLIFNF